ncbi:Uncharacterised protein [uncultured archaeon]|nr:Uncharacterised protein [uncultured archaeon]
MNKLEIVFETANPAICCILDGITAEIRDGHISGKAEGYYHWELF